MCSSSCSHLIRSEASLEKPGLRLEAICLQGFCTQLLHSRESLLKFLKLVLTPRVVRHSLQLLVQGSPIHYNNELSFLVISYRKLILTIAAYISLEYTPGIHVVPRSYIAGVTKCLEWACSVELHAMPDGSWVDGRACKAAFCHIAILEVRHDWNAEASQKSQC